MENHVAGTVIRRWTHAGAALRRVASSSSYGNKFSVEGKEI